MSEMAEFHCPLCPNVSVGNTPWLDCQGTVSEPHERVAMNRKPFPRKTEFTLGDKVRIRAHFRVPGKDDGGVYTVFHRRVHVGMWWYQLIEIPGEFIGDRLEEVIG